MNLPNKITMVRIVLSIVLLVLLIIPVSFPTYLWFGKVTVSLKYIIGGVVFLVASLSDSLDGYVARKNHQVTDFGKVMDAIADKMLVNGELPLTIGGGIGQSRLCMLLLEKAHIGEVHASIWPDDMVAKCKEAGINLL